MYAASIQSTTGTIAGYAKKMAHLGRPDMEIILDNHQDGKTYTTFDPVSGRVEITAPHEARFDEVQITLEGTIKTFVENLSPHTTKARTTARHTFLRLTMPIRDADYPQPRIAEAGRTYTFPFNFVIPDQLLPRSCTHNCNNPSIHEAHLRLPPSMGDRELTKLDDLSPEMSKVTYAIKTKVIRNRERDGREVLLVQGMKKLRIIPAVAEEPPMNVGLADKDYTLSKTKSLKKGMFSGKLGKITVSALQPSALVLPSPSSGSSVPETTMATINLRFDPHSSSSQPPKLGGLTTKLKTNTFYAARAAPDFPSYTSYATHFDALRGIYQSSTSLSSRCVEAVSWTPHTPSPAYVQRRGSETSNSTCSSDSCSDSETPDPSPAAMEKTYYTATILLPLTLPSTKTWLPTFNSCILSRTYTLDTTLTIHTPGTGVPASSVHLRLPVQIAAKGGAERRGTLSDEELARELADADEFFRARVLEVPGNEYVGGSVLDGQGVERGELRRDEGVEMPPSYEDFGVVRRGVVSRG